MLDNFFTRKSSIVLAIMLSFLAVVALVFTIFREQDRVSQLLQTKKTFSLSIENSLEKYPFDSKQQIGIRQSPNFPNKIDIWGKFEKIEEDVFLVKVFSDTLRLPLPKDNKVFQGSEDPKNFKYLDLSNLNKETLVIVTLTKTGDMTYLTENVQLPFYSSP